MGVQVLIIGGAKSGKSSYAEKLAQNLPSPRYYIATMPPHDDESRRRIQRHRRQRAGKGFETVEQYRDLETLTLPRRGTVLLECVATLTANEMFAPNGVNTAAAEKVLRSLAALKERCDTLLVVSNTVDVDGARYTADVVRYIQAVNHINSALAARSTHVVELCCGIALPLKGALPL